MTLLIRLSIIALATTLAVLVAVNYLNPNTLGGFF